MRVLIYSEGMRLIAKSGVGKAVHHQEQALTMNHIPCQINGFYDYDLVHINTVGILSVYKAIEAKLRGRKVVVHAHSTEEDFRNSFFFANAVAPLFKQWLKFVYGLGDLLITPTPYSKKVLRGYGLKKEIIPLSNGIDLDRFTHDDEGAQTFRNTYGIGADEKIVLSVGLQIRRKGIHDFIELAGRMPDHRFVWCGYTHPKLMTADIREAMENAPDNVLFTGYLNDLVGAYSAADVVFMPTYEETEGIVILEALANRKTVVVRDIPVYEDWLIHGVHCYKGRDNKDFEELIRGVTSGKLIDCAEAGYQVVQERDIEKIGKDLIHIYNRLAGEVTHEI